MKEYFKNKRGFWATLVYEIVCTYSNERSFFSSKRIERSVMFVIAMWMIVGFVLRKWSELTVDNILVLSGFLLGFGAWNAVQIRKDKQVENEPNENLPNPNNAK